MGARIKASSQRVGCPCTRSRKIRSSCTRSNHKTHIVRELYGFMVAEKAARDVFVTTGTFTPDAVEFAHGKPLELVG